MALPESFFDQEIELIPQPPDAHHQLMGQTPVAGLEPVEARGVEQVHGIRAPGLQAKQDFEGGLSRSRYLQCEVFETFRSSAPAAGEMGD